MFKTLTVCILFFLFLLIRCDDNEETNEIFVPTKEWRTVKQGQKIPKGLHVRINLETGVKEAKLLDEDETKALSVTSSEEESFTDKTLLKSDLEEAVKSLKNDDVLNPDEIKQIKDRFRSYDEIKQSLKDLNLTPKLDAEIIADLIQKHKDLVNAEDLDKTELLKLLEDLDYLAHQYDNAHEFVKQKGFSEIVYKNLNSSMADVRRETLKLMTSLMQNNAAPKIHALETGSIGIILRLINSDPDYGVRLRAVSTLSALLRSFPAAQKNFVGSGGLSVLSKVFDSEDIKIQIKVITMISDLIIEHESSGSDQNLAKYYKSLDLIQVILEYDWCGKLNKLLLGLVIIDKDDHDSVEKCLVAMSSLGPHCGGKYSVELLVNLKKRYYSLASESSEVDLFFESLKQLCDDILRFRPKSAKTEL